MVISETPIESHAVHRDLLIKHARRMLRDGDRLQACENIWGTAAHGLKVIADRRGWPYTLHSDGRVIASYLGKLTGSKGLPRLFSHLEGLPRSFYADSFSLQEIESGCRTRTSFCGSSRPPTAAFRRTRRRRTIRSTSAAMRASAGLRQQGRGAATGRFPSRVWRGAEKKHRRRAAPV